MKPLATGIVANCKSTSKFGEKKRESKQKRDYTEIIKKMKLLVTGIVANCKSTSKFGESN